MRSFPRGMQYNPEELPTSLNGKTLRVRYYTFTYIPAKEVEGSYRLLLNPYYKSYMKNIV